MKMLIKERTFRFAVEVVKFSKFLITEKKEYIISRQLMRAATSVGANVRKAQNGESKADFIHKMGIAQKEIDETIYWIELIIETEDSLNNKPLELLNEANELLKIIRSIILTTKKNYNQK